MRKWLLTGVATAGFAGTAMAQDQTPSAMPLPVGVLGAPTKPSTYLGGNNMMNQDGNRPPRSPMAMTPGAVVVHLNGRAYGLFGVVGSSASVVGGNKLAPESFEGQFRLYPGVDALATNGLRYGAIAEIRQNFIGQTYGSTTAGLPGPAAAYGSSPSAASCGSTLFVAARPYISEPTSSELSGLARMMARSANSTTA